MTEKRIDKIKAQSNLISHKGVLNYDTHNEKQVYDSLPNLKRIKFRSILLYFFASLMLVALQEIWILNPLKHQKSLKF